MPAGAIGSKGRRLTPEERDQIIQLRLNRVPVRTVAEQMECTTKTVVEVWKKFWAEESVRRADQLENERSLQMGRMDQIASDARRSYVTAMREKDFGAAARFLAEERMALAQLQRVSGLEHVKVEHTGNVAITAVTWEERIIAAEPTKPAIEQPRQNFLEGEIVDAVEIEQ